jgi:hypothetical protein
MVLKDEKQPPEGEKIPAAVTFSKDETDQDFWIHINESTNGQVQMKSTNYQNHIFLRVSDISEMYTSLIPEWEGSNSKVVRFVIKTKTTTLKLSPQTGDKVIAQFEACRPCLRVESDLITK